MTYDGDQPLDQIVRDMDRRLADLETAIAELQGLIRNITIALGGLTANQQAMQGNHSPEPKGDGMSERGA